MRWIVTSIKPFSSTLQQQRIFNGKLLPISYFIRQINDYENHFNIAWISHTHKHSHKRIVTANERVEINKFDCCFSFYWIWQWSMYTTITSSIWIACKHTRNGHCIRRYLQKKCMPSTLQRLLAAAQTWWGFSWFCLLFWLIFLSVVVVCSFLALHSCVDFYILLLNWNKRKKRIEWMYEKRAHRQHQRCVHDMHELRRVSVWEYACGVIWVRWASEIMNS